MRPTFPSSLDVNSSNFWSAAHLESLASALSAGAEDSPLPILQSSSCSASCSSSSCFNPISPNAWMRFWNVLLLLAIHVLSVAAAGNYTGVTSGTNLPYIVHFPLSSVSPPYPAVIFLHGSGSVGTVSDLDNNAFWDGVGKLCSDYDSGSGDAAAKEAVENYLIILPLCTASYCRFVLFFSCTSTILAADSSLKWGPETMGASRWCSTPGSARSVPIA